MPQRKGEEGWGITEHGDSTLPAYKGAVFHWGSGTNQSTREAAPSTAREASGRRRRTSSTRGQHRGFKRVWREQHPPLGRTSRDLRSLSQPSGGDKESSTSLTGSKAFWQNFRAGQAWLFPSVSAVLGPRLPKCLHRAA